MCVETFTTTPGGFAACLLMATWASVSIGGCAALPRQPAVPPELTTRAITPGMPESRYWPDIDARPLFRDSLLSVDREWQALDEAGDHDGHLPPSNSTAA